ncbi:hypothetical protein H0H87_010648, partial [Tephrocybe sp. NHM501043]
MEQEQHRDEDRNKVPDATVAGIYGTSTEEFIGFAKTQAFHTVAKAATQLIIDGCASDPNSTLPSNSSSSTSNAVITNDMQQKPATAK